MKTLCVPFGALVDLVTASKLRVIREECDSDEQFRAYVAESSASLRALSMILAKGYNVGSYTEIFFNLRERLDAIDIDEEPGALGALAGALVEEYGTEREPRARELAEQIQTINARMGERWNGVETYRDGGHPIGAVRRVEDANDYDREALAAAAVTLAAHILADS